MIGGLNLKKVADSEFKYTRSTDRIKWTKHAIPIGEYLITCIRKIPWLEYKYEGKTTLSYANEESTCIFDEIEINADLPSEPYYFFGGCVYEILNAFALAERSRNPDTPYVNLRDYVDPTGDIDVKIVLPRVQPIGSVDYDYSDYMLKENGTHMNSLVDHYTRWIFDRLKEQIESYAAIFDRLFENTERFELSQEPVEAVKADIFVRIGNLWLVRLLNPDLPIVKIQVVAKFIDTEPDHILEIVLPLSNKCEDDTIFKNNIPINMVSNIKNGLRISSFSELIEGNNDALKARIDLHNGELRYKFYNHVGRLQYLNKYVSMLSPHDIQEFVRPGPEVNRQLLILFDTLSKSLIKGELQLYSYSNGGSNINGNILRSLISNLVIFTETTGSYPSKQGTRVKAEKVFEILNPYLSAKGGYKRRTSRKVRRFRTSTNIRRTRSKRLD